MRLDDHETFNYWFRECRSRWIVAAISCVTLAPVAMATYVTFGGEGLFFFIPAVGTVALVIALLGTVGRRVGTLGQALRAEGAEVASALISDGILQTPGTVALTSTQLILVPVLGRQKAVALWSIRSVEESAYFNGSLLVARTGFWLEHPGGGRTGFAVSNAVAGTFREVLKRASASPRG